MRCTNRHEHELSSKTSMFDTFSNLQDKIKSSGKSRGAVAQSVERPSKDTSLVQLYWLTWVRIAVIGKKLQRIILAAPSAKRRDKCEE